MSAAGAPEWRDRAIAAERGGDAAGARAVIEQGIAACPDDPALANTAGNIAMRSGDPAAAEAHFANAARLAPDELEFAVNHALALSRLGKPQAAIAVLAGHETAGHRSTRYGSARGAAERAARNPEASATWYERCLALEPGHSRALHGRARIAIERGESDAPARFERALEVSPGEADLWLGKAQALDVAGETAAARGVAETLVAQAPHWLDALRFLAQLRLAGEEREWDAHYREAAARLPGNADIPVAHARQLAGLDRFEEAAAVAAAARQRFPDHPQFALLEAVHAGEAGDDERAERIFAELTLDTPERAIHEARHRIRRGELARAEELIDKALAADRWNISAWALRGIVWRLRGDPRSQWLHEQAGLVRLMPLDGGKRVLAAVAPLLHALHDGSPLPLGQSLRGGSQSRGILFHRTEPELAAVEAALLRTLKAYREGLPPRDDAHPLLRHRDAEWRLEGSWSVRLSGGGDFHTAHIHPQGILSSALYCEVPPAHGSDPEEGWLEVGRPPPDLRLDLPPLRTIEPRDGHLALFPSTLYHGTRPFGSGRRMSIAFDVALAEGDGR